MFLSLDIRTSPSRRIKSMKSNTVEPQLSDIRLTNTPGYTTYHIETHWNTEWAVLTPRGVVHGVYAFFVV